MDNEGMPNSQATQTASEKSQESNQGEDKSYIKYRIEKALKKKEPEIYSKAKKEILMDLGIETDDLDEVKELFSKLQSSKSESEKTSSELGKIKKLIEQERSEKVRLQEELASHKKHLNEKLISEAISTASEKYKVRNLNQVSKLLRDQLIVDDGKVRVLDEHGEVSNESLEKLLDNFYKNNEHFLIASAPAGGAGSRPVTSPHATAQVAKELLSSDGREAAFLKFMQEAKVN